MENKKIEDIVFTIFDTETTGDNQKREDRPIEIAAINWNIKNGFIGKPKSWLVDPKMSIHPSAIAVHGLTDDDVVGKPVLEEIYPELIDYIGDNVLVAHNIDFDLKMLPKVDELPNKRIDTLRFARHIFNIGDLGYKDHPLYSHKMQELRYWLNLKVDTMGLSAHRAAADILVTGLVFNSLITNLIEKNADILYIDELVEFSSAPILIEKMPFGKYSGVLIEEAIKKEINTPKNYFNWLMKSIKSGEFKIDPDLLFSINYYFKKIGVYADVVDIEKSLKNSRDFKKQVNA